MTANELALADTNRFAVMPVMDLNAAKRRRENIIEFTKSLMEEKVHYGTIPGTGNKPTLFKAGAEMLTTFFGLSPHFVAEEVTEDWTGSDHDGEPFFYYRYRCQLYRGDMLVGEGLGSCNSWEKKYRYRTAGRVCPECDADAISRSKFPPRSNPNGKKGWWCRECKTDYAYGDERIVGQETGKVPNDNPADLVNTIDKMAQKRALVAATLIAVNASEFFTQDIEDLDLTPVEGEYTEVDEKPAQKPRQKAKKKTPAPKAKTNGNGGTDLAQFAIDFAEKHPYFNDNFHVVGTLRKLYGEGIGGTFRQRSISEYEDSLDKYASLRSDGVGGDDAVAQVKGETEAA